MIDGCYHGIGVACFIEGAGMGPKETRGSTSKPTARLRSMSGPRRSARASKRCMGQIAADTLGIALDQVRVVHGSTPYLKEGYGAFHSRSTILGGSAVLEGARALVEKIRVAAAARCGVEAEDIEFVDGRARTRDGRALSLAELAADHLRVDVEFSNNNTLTYAYGSAAAHVAVDPGTGRVELLDYVAVEDVGRIVNPLTLHGQAVGGIVQGLGGAMMENLVYDTNGQLLSGSLADYLIPTATDFPTIRAFALQNHPSPSNPLGVKGAGEGMIIPTGGLMANAIANALASFGAMPTALPLSPARVWRMASTAGQSTSKNPT